MKYLELLLFFDLYLIHITYGKQPNRNSKCNFQYGFGIVTGGIG
jgi:hypothetical protein